MDKSKKGTLLLILGWGLYLTCLLLPAVNYNEHSIHKGPLLGWMAGNIAISYIFHFTPKLEWLQFSLCGLGNILATSSILCIYLNNKKALKYFSASFLILSLVASRFYFEYYSLGYGYYLWVLSFIVISYSYYIAYKETSLTRQSNWTNNP